MRRLGEIARALPWRELAGDLLGVAFLMLLGAELLFFGWVLG